MTVDNIPGLEALNKADRIILQGGRPRQRQQHAVGVANQTKLIGEQSPARAYQTGTKRGFSGPRQRWQNHTAALFFHDGTVQHEVMVRGRPDTPVQPPFIHGKGVIHRIGFERPHPVYRELHLGADEAAQALHPINSDMVVCRLGLLQQRDRRIETAQNIEERRNV